MKKKEMIELTKEERKTHSEQKFCYICKQNFVLIMTIKNTVK